MSVLGMTGITAYFGLLDVGRPVAGETVVVSGAAGATGSIVGQIAKIKGCRAIGIAGGAEKCRWLTDDPGFDAAIDYKSENVPARLKELCPKGIDIFFDNVGGVILDAALARLAMRGRVVLCGGIATTMPTEPSPGPKNYLNLVVQRGRMEGFLVLRLPPAPPRRSARSPAGCIGKAQLPKSTCSTALRTRWRRCGGCSKAATTASNSCASRSEPSRAIAFRA